MKNIFLILKYDLKNVAKNIIVFVVVIGIGILPALYSWFNIASNWDPYSNTAALDFAVCSLDKGYSYKSLKINAGDEIVENLKEHTLQTFSQYWPLKKWVYIGPEHAVNTTGTPGKPQYVFKIPKPDDEPIVDILEVIFGPYSVKCIQCAG